MVELEIDGRTVSVPEGSMVMHAAHELGLYIPHFCYHRKLSIAANCRMCLVDVEKAPKALPACATPVTKGMKVHTASARAIEAQKAVMEFLLINHPLDCPICDQGGECQLQDLAVGYGGGTSRFAEEKRVVFHKQIGPLISAEEMSRCIQCTRCVRFGQEIAGVMELGMGGRGEHSEIMTFLGRSVDSELSGNMIDICPVGALTSKPFRYSARTWELRRRRTVAPHDSLGSNVVVQCKQDRVMRVLPFENEEINQCWLSDRDRFSYEGVNAPDRLHVPMIKQGGQWIEASWEQALGYVAETFRDIAGRHGAQSLSALVAPHATLEEMALTARLMRGLGSENIDFRLRQADFSADALERSERANVPWLGMAVAEVDQLEGLLIVGSYLRKDHPLLSARVRAATRSGMQLASLHGVTEDWLMPVAAPVLAPPSGWLAALRAVLQHCRTLVDNPLAHVADSPESAAARALLNGSRRAVWLGNAAVQHPQHAELAAVARSIAAVTGARYGEIGEAANSVGGHLADVRPGRGGRNVAEMIREGSKGWLLVQLEPDLDLADPVGGMKALGEAASVVALTPFRSTALMEVADCLLPIVPFAETGGTFVSAEGRVQSFQGVTLPQGQARPGWKVLRVLGNQLGLKGFDAQSVEEVRDEVLKANPVAERLAHAPAQEAAGKGVKSTGKSTEGSKPAVRDPNQLERLTDVPIYAVDGLVRRAGSLQRTRDAQAPLARVNGRTLERMGLSAGVRARVRAEGSAPGAGVVLNLERDDTLADGVIRIPAAHPLTAGLPSFFGDVRVERAA